MTGWVVVALAALAGVLLLAGIHAATRHHRTDPTEQDQT